MMGKSWYGAGGRRVRPTARELEILQALADGLRQREVATRLNLERNSIGSRLHLMRGLFGCSTNLQLMAQAAALGWVQVEVEATRRAPEEGSDA